MWKTVWPASRVGVEDGPEAAIRVAPLACERGSAADHLADERIVLWGERVEAVDVLPGHDQRVQRRLRVDVAEGDEPIVLVNHRCRNLAVHDFAEETVSCHSPPLFQIPAFA